MDPWVDMYVPNLVVADQFHTDIGKTYHACTYAHYGADAQRHSYQNIVWQTRQAVSLRADELMRAPSVNASGLNALKLALSWGKDNSDPARVLQDGKQIVFEIAPAGEPGDDTVPQNSGAGPFISGGQNVRQSHRLASMSEGHAGSYDDENVRQLTLHSIAKIIAESME